MHEVFACSALKVAVDSEPAVDSLTVLVMQRQLVSWQMVARTVLTRVEPR